MTYLNIQTQEKKTTKYNFPNHFLLLKFLEIAERPCEVLPGGPKEIHKAVVPGYALPKEND